MIEQICENKNYKNLFDGSWIASSDANYIDIKSPIDDSVVGRVPAMSQEDVDKVIKNSKNAQRSWRNVPLSERANILYKVSDLILENAGELSDLMLLEIAKDKKSALSEVTRTADLVKFTADSAETIQGQSIQSDSFPGFNRNKISVVSREPLGVVLAISPFNYPVNLAASKIAPALVSGNSVVFKPATSGSLSGLFLAKLFDLAGVPKGVLNTVTGKGSIIGDYIVTHPGIDFINFTGSTDVGCRISKITTMVPLLMELGGKDAAIVLEDADLDLTAKNIVSGGFSYSGQRCTAVKRILVIDSVADKLIDKVKNEMTKLKVGNPLEMNADVVPLINTKSADYVSELIDDATKKGAIIVKGGKREGNLIYPTLFDKVTTDMRIAWEEPFGPVLPVIRVKDKDEAISIANNSEYGLQSSVFTNDINDAFYVSDRLEVGSVQINNKPERGPDHFPFLGVKASGIGTQGIKYSIESMTRLKATVINLKRD